MMAIRQATTANWLAAALENTRVEAEWRQRGEQGHGHRHQAPTRRKMDLLWLIVARWHRPPATSTLAVYQRCIEQQATSTHVGSLDSKNGLACCLTACLLTAVRNISQATHDSPLSAGNSSSKGIGLPRPGGASFLARMTRATMASVAPVGNPQV